MVRCLVWLKGCFFWIFIVVLVEENKFFLYVLYEKICVDEVGKVGEVFFIIFMLIIKYSCCRGDGSVFEFFFLIN